MDNNNWRPTAVQGAEPSVDPGGDWRATLPPDSRHRIVNKIMETLKRHLPFSGQEGLEELKKIAVRFEEKIYSAALNQSDYLRKISLKMLTMDSKSQNPIPNSLPSNPTGNNNRPPDSGAPHNMQPQVHNQGAPLPMAMSANQSQACQQEPQQLEHLMALQNNMSRMHEQQYNASSDLHQQQRPLPGNSTVQNNQPSVHMQQRTVQNSSLLELGCI